MQLVFIDETSDDKYKDYFGICCAVMSSHSYAILKRTTQKILIESGWDPNIEFKGCTLFSGSRGDISISVEKRIEIATNLLKLNISKKHSRIKFFYLNKNSNDFAKDYLKVVPILLNKALPRGKDLLSFHFDRYDSVGHKELRKLVQEVLIKKKLELLEDINPSNSNFETIGILFVDLVGYLLGRIKTISNDLDLFKDLTEEQRNKNGKLKKLESSTNLIKLIKQIKVYKLVSK
jgi:hypothetical protein